MIGIIIRIIVFINDRRLLRNNQIIWHPIQHFLWFWIGGFLNTFLWFHLFVTWNMAGGIIKYSPRYKIGDFIYRYVVLPANLAKHVPTTHLMTESEWRNLGIRMTSGWLHYCKLDSDTRKNFEARFKDPYSMTKSESRETSVWQHHYNNILNTALNHPELFKKYREV